jgi:hypothetical protein
MSSPRLSIARLMGCVAFVALNLAMMRALNGGAEEGLLLDALPTVNVLALMGIAGLYRPRLRPFALGFVVTGAVSLLTLEIWARANPWTFLRYVQPACDALEAGARAACPSGSVAIMYGTLIVAFALPHALLGLAGGCLAERRWGGAALTAAGTPTR